MVNFVMGDSPYMRDLAEKYATSVYKDGRVLEIRTCPMKPSKSEWQLALHAGFGFKWYALNGTARRSLLMQTMQVEAYELFIMGIAFNFQRFPQRPRSIKPAPREQTGGVYNTNMWRTRPGL